MVLSVCFRLLSLGIPLVPSVFFLKSSISKWYGSHTDFSGRDGYLCHSWSWIYFIYCRVLNIPDEVISETYIIRTVFISYLFHISKLNLHDEWWQSKELRVRMIHKHYQICPSWLNFTYNWMWHFSSLLHILLISQYPCNKSYKVKWYLRHLIKLIP